jgi:hypothetical protein
MNEIRQSQPNTLGFHDEALDFMAQQLLALPRAGFREFGYYRANARAHLDPTFLDKLLNDLLRRVWMNLQSGCETAA